MNVLWASVITVVVTAVAIACMLLVRRRAPEGSYFQDGDRAAGVFGVLATGYAVFAGFVIFLAFTTYDQSRNGAEAEALLVAQQFETAQFMPGAVRDRLSGELVCYARTVVEQEWPKMEAGAAGDALNPWGVALFRTLKMADPKTAAEQAAYSKWLDQTSEREEARRDRIHGAANVIPDSLWLVLLVTAAVIFVFMLFFADSAEGPITQALLIGSVRGSPHGDPARHPSARYAVQAWFRPVTTGRDGAHTRDPRRRASGRQRLDRAALRLSRSGNRLMVTERRLELAATVLLALAAVATAWASYQSSRWHGKQAQAQSASIAARVESSKAAAVANRQVQIDVALFTQWVDAYATGETELADFYRRRFRDEFEPAFEAWVATGPLPESRRATLPLCDARVPTCGHEGG